MLEQHLLNLDVEAFIFEQHDTNPQTASISAAQLPLTKAWLMNWHTSNSDLRPAENIMKVTTGQSRAKTAEQLQHGTPLLKESSSSPQFTHVQNHQIPF